MPRYIAWVLPSEQTARIAESDVFEVAEGEEPESTEAGIKLLQELFWGHVACGFYRICERCDKVTPTKNDRFCSKACAAGPLKPPPRVEELPKPKCCARPKLGLTVRNGVGAQVCFSCGKVFDSPSKKIDLPVPGTVSTRDIPVSPIPLCTDGRCCSNPIAHFDMHDGRREIKCLNCGKVLTDSRGLEDRGPCATHRLHGCMVCEPHQWNINAQTKKDRSAHISHLFTILRQAKKMQESHRGPVRGSLALQHLGFVLWEVLEDIAPEGVAPGENPW